MISGEQTQVAYDSKLDPCMTCTILIADDHEVVRSGLKVLLEGSPFSIVAESETVEETLERASLFRPRIVLLDVRLRGGSGFAALETLVREQPGIAVLMFTAHDNPMFVQRAMTSGAKGYLLKDCGREELLKTLDRLAAGGDGWSQESQRRIQGALVTPRLQKDLDAPLTEREAEVLREMTAGHTNQQIAKSLSISVETVKEHVQHILRKVGVTDRTQAAVWAVRNGVG